MVRGFLVLSLVLLESSFPCSFSFPFFFLFFFDGVPRFLDCVGRGTSYVSITAASILLVCFSMVLSTRRGYCVCC